MNNFNKSSWVRAAGVALGLGVGVLAVTSFAEAAFPASVTAVAVQKGQSVTVKGRLESGAVMQDLSWASNSSVACFPATQNERFRGNHVLYSAQLPPQSVMTITVIPKDPKADMSIYAYQVGTTNFTLPPQLASCVACEAEHKWDRPKKGRTQDHTRSVTLNSLRNPYNIVIGVSGPAGAKGEFDLKVDIK